LAQHAKEHAICNMHQTFNLYP